MNGTKNWEKTIFPFIRHCHIRSVFIKSSLCHIEEAYQECSFDISFEKCQLVYSSNEVWTAYKKSVRISKLCNKQSFKVCNCINVSEKAKRIDDHVLNEMMCFQHYQCTFKMCHLNLDGTNISNDNVLMIAK